MDEAQDEHDRDKTKQRRYQDKVSTPFAVGPGPGTLEASPSSLIICQVFISTSAGVLISTFKQIGDANPVRSIARRRP